ncbi:MAG: CPBP family intramembrane metalloprotease [Chitinophagaceae bacterium]|nr:CPBP family intramembrane metalloprotease [Chitinophagaceae bacterium]
MIGIIIQLIISWLLVWLFEKKGLGVLGFYPTKRRLLQFAFFFLITALCSTSDFIMRMVFAKEQWQLNPNLTASLILSGLWWNIKSVLFEELIFRGALMYILIKKLGPVKAIIISSIAFGIYHWFSHEVFGNPVQMIITFLTTGLMGVVYAFGYAKTFSLYVPIAIHLGWNLVRSVVFSETVIGNQLLVQVKPVPQVTVGYFIYFCVVYVPMLSALLINFFVLRKMKQQEAPE